ncbi:Importin-9 [Vanrija pseudolonga]|uniref:Importin-9 n=1 Tax=Vanrija pseudolonga TaxID=143232 RepID=A0AAF0Y8S6_9TREE|nr:Importin-9 [Vanrija pseudolonga]
MASTSGTSSPHLDQQVLACLEATLSPDEATRHAAEDQLQTLYSHPEGGLSLARLLSEQAVPLPQRQISPFAGILLQKYIEKHWYPGADAFTPPTTPAEVKDAIRPLLLRTLSDPERKVRVAAAFAASSIAKFDWPEDWSDLLSSLVSLLQTGNPNSVHGAMRVVIEFVKNDISEDQLVPVVTDLVPAILAILGNPQTHSFATRAETVAVYRHILTLLGTLKDEHPAAVRQALDQIAPVWFDAFSQLLAVDAAADVAQSWDSLALRIQIFRILLQYQLNFPRYIAKHVPTFLRLSIINLTSLLQTFHSYYISSDPDSPSPPEPASDAPMDLDDLASAVFEYLEPTVRVKESKDILVEGAAGDERGTAVLDTIVGLVLTYTQVTREQEEEWLEDANAFVEDEDEDNMIYSLRVVGHDLMGSLIDKWPRAVGRTVNDFTHRRVQESAAAHKSGDPDWWKPLETILGLLGGISDDLRSLLEEDQEAGRPATFDLPFLFNQVIPDLLQQTEAPFLQGRAFVFASQFAGLLPAALAQEYLSTAILALGSPTTSVPVKISAVKTIKNFCRHVDASIMNPQAGKILSMLLPILPETSAETLYLVMETVNSVVSLDKDSLTVETTQAICQHVYAEWFRNMTDPVLTAIVEEVVDGIAASSSPAVVSTLVSFFAPKLAELIITPVTDETVYVPGEAVQLANALIKPRGGPLEAELIATVTVAVMTCLQQTDDMDVIQHGMIHLTLVVRKDCEKLIQWHDADGSNGIARIFALLGRFLAPTFSESGGIFVGDLIMHLFRKAGQAIAPVLGDLLRAVVNRLATAQLSSFIQSLIIPFAYLFGTEHTQQTIDLLLSFPPVHLPDGTTKPALDLVLSSWCETAETITGSWNIRVSDLGMAKLFTMPSPALRNVLVRGDLIINENNRNKIMTRSRTKATPNEYTQIPFPVKALKLLLKDVSAEGKGKSKGDELGIEDDDGDEEWDDDDPLASAGPTDEFAFLSDWLDDGPGENDAQDDDEDLKSDPLAQIDLGAHLTDVIRSSYASNDNGIHEMVAGLTDSEKATLRGVLTVA